MARMNRWLLWVINRRNRRRSERLVDRLGPILSVGPTSSVLELGAGAGGLSAALYDRYHPARVVITDFDEHQVDAARRALARRYGTVPPAIELGTADALSLAFPTASFDLVVAIGVLHHVEARHRDYERRPAALAEIRRVLRPGGTFVYTEFTRTAEVRATLTELGFVPRVPTTSLGHEELGVFAAPPAPVG